MCAMTTRPGAPSATKAASAGDDLAGERRRTGVDRPMRDDGPIPLHVVTGFLGSGKTTLINRLMRARELADALVVVNEWGEVGLDHLLFEAVEGDVILLASGCLCCSLRGDLIDCLRDVLARRDFGRARALFPHRPGDERPLRSRADSARADGRPAPGAADDPRGSDDAGRRRQRRGDAGDAWRGAPSGRARRSDRADEERSRRGAGPRRAARASCARRSRTSTPSRRSSTPRPANSASRSSSASRSTFPLARTARDASVHAELDPRLRLRGVRSRSARPRWRASSKRCGRCSGRGCCA